MGRGRGNPESIFGRRIAGRCERLLQRNGGRTQNFISGTAAPLSVISPSSQASVPYTNYSCQQLNVFMPFCLLYYSTFIPLFSTHLFTRIKAYSDRIIPLHNKNKSQHLHTHIILIQRAQLNYRWPLSPQICISLAFPSPRPPPPRLHVRPTDVCMEDCGMGADSQQSRTRPLSQA